MNIAIERTKGSILTKISTFSQEKDVFSYVLIALTSLYCTFPLFLHQALPKGHDIIFHIFQADQFYKSLADGVIIPRWVLNSNGGYGSANFVFYSPLSYYLTAAVHFIVPSLVQSMILVIWISFFLSGTAMYFAAKEISCRDRALLPAILYQIIPFHIFDLYYRGSFAELVSYIWFPLVIVFAHKALLRRNDRKVLIWLAISYAGMVLTHLVSAFIMTIILMIYIVYHAFFKSTKKNIPYMLVILALGAGLTSYFIIPIIFERGYAQLKYITQISYFNYANNFLYVIDNLKRVNDYKFYLQLNLLSIVETTIFFVIIKFNRRCLFTIFGILFLLALYLTLPLSSLIWSHVPGFATLQFPWRWVVVMELSLCFLCCMIFSENKQVSNLLAGPDRIIVYCIAVLAALSTSTIFLFEPLGKNDLESVTDPAKVVHYKKLPKEYTPVWAFNLSRLPYSAQVKKIAVLSGAAEAIILDWKSEIRTIRLKVYEPAILDIAAFYYPGWKAEIDGKEVLVGIRRTSGTMLVSVPKGEHQLEMKFSDTPLRLYSKYVTLVSCILLFLFISVCARHQVKAVGSRK